MARSVKSDFLERKPNKLTVRVKVKYRKTRDLDIAIIAALYVEVPFAIHLRNRKDHKQKSHLTHATGLHLCVNSKGSGGP